MKKSILWTLVGILGLFIFLPLIFQYFYPNNSFNLKGGCFMWPGHFMMGGMWIFPVIVMIFVLIVIYSVTSERGANRIFPRDSDRDRATDRNSETALEILKKRYATGEITQEEFEQMKKVLDS